MAYPAEVWTAVEYDYKTGNYSQEELSKKHSIPLPTIKTHFKTSGIVKGELVEKVRERKAEAFTRVFEQMGVNREYLVNKVKEFMEAKKVEVVPSKAVNPETGEKEPGFAEEVPDRWAQEKGLAHYEKMCGIPEAEAEAGAGRGPVEIKVLIVGGGVDVKGLVV